MANGEFLINNNSLRKILNTLPQDIIIQDLNHKIIWANKNAIKNYGSMGKVTGEFCYKIKYDLEKSCENCPVKSVKETGKSRTEEIVKSNGKTLLIKVFPIKDEEGDIIAISEVTMDITERKQKEERLQKIKEANMKAKMKKELDIAYKIQTSFIPSDNPQYPKIDLSTYYAPAQLVGGDYFDFFQKDNKVGIIISDVMGKGITAALIVATLHSSFHTMINYDYNPTTIIRNLNDILYKDLKETPLFVTTFYCLFDLKNKILKYSNAGHNPPIYWSAEEKKISLLDKAGILCGVQANYKYSAYELDFNKDDILLLYTDGLLDIRNMKEERFQIDRLKEILAKNKHLSADKLKDRILTTIRSFSNQKTGDDISFVLCKIKG